MNWSKFVSRKLLATIACVAVVIVADLIGAPLDQASLDAVTNMLLGLVGAQGLVDTAGAWRTGTAISGAVVSIQDLAEADTDADGTGDPKMDDR